MNKDTLYTQTPLILDNPPSNVTDIEALQGAFYSLFDFAVRNILYKIFYWNRY